MRLLKLQLRKSIRSRQERGPGHMPSPSIRPKSIVTGTIKDLCFYQMEGAYFTCRKSSLTGKRFRKEKAFAGSRRSCGLRALASPLASRLYRRLPKEKKGRAVFQEITGGLNAFSSRVGQKERLPAGLHKPICRHTPIRKHRSPLW